MVWSDGANAMPREDEVPEFCDKLALSPIRLCAKRSSRGERIRLKKVVDEVQGLIAVDRGKPYVMSRNTNLGITQ